MRTYKRVWIPGGTYFFTVNLAQRRNTTLLIDHIAQLRAAFQLARIYGLLPVCNAYKTIERR